MEEVGISEFSSWLAHNGGQSDEQHHLASVGEKVGGWRLLAYLGSGGSGEVWRVINDESGKTAVVKILIRTDEDDLRRFELATSFLSVSNLKCFPEYFDKGVWKGHPFVVIEELEPMELPRTDPAIAKFLLDVIGAVREIHSRGFVHRDIKPSNIMTRGGRESVLIDLGLMKDVSMSDQSSRISSVTIVNGKAIAAGTPGYAAPEQLTGGEISPASDIHALGVLIDACFRGEVPRTWQPIVRRATSSLPGLRYESVVALAKAIRRRNSGRKAIIGIISALALGAVAAAGYWTYGKVKDAVTAVYVSAGAPAEGANGSQKHPFSNIASAIAVAKRDAYVMVGPGTYKGCYTITNHPINLVSTCDESKCVLISDGSSSVISLGGSADGSLIRGFTITGGRGFPRKVEHGYDYYGGGVFATCSGVIENCVIVGNGLGVPKQTSATFGGGVCVRGATLTINNCLITNNFAWASGGGILADGDSSSVVLDRCTIAGNGSVEFFGLQAGLGLANGAVALACDSIFVGNRGDQLGAFGGEYSRGTRARLVRSYVEGGAKACNIKVFLVDEPKVELDSTVGYRPFSVR